MTHKVHLDHAHLRHLLKAMIRIRHFEAKCVELYQAQKILGFLHLYDGEEAVSVGVMEALTAKRRRGRDLSRAWPGARPRRRSRLPDGGNAGQTQWMLPRTRRIDAFFPSCASLLWR